MSIFNIYDKEIDITDDICKMFETYAGIPLTEKMGTHFVDICCEAEHISPFEISSEEISEFVLECMSRTIAANNGEEAQDVFCF